jgi:magnesium and cobalt transporter
VKASVEVSAFNEKFGTAFRDDESDTVGGLITHHLARVPHRGESVVLGGFKFTVLRADGRRVWLMTVERV